ncbi:DUF3696 domain-containing protein [Aquiflexum sp. LQ15W]|uniref:AAA family ATPase n=1 Tax=Cognataquiflexum nitidum TaxID=2922272 RepID=UPI001F12A774|nr:DUF3696 domain-containing protein [Cognataquiflexum nitidum]MCH6198565.1 DUF3696 domain-containing protein [Cognataquiflexum nitidum]
MSYLHTLGLENFRLFKEKAVFNLAPITLLTGQNSSGKSSLIKSLLLLKSSISETGGLEELNFSGGKHHLGWYGQVLNFKSESNELVFTFDFPFPQLIDKTFIDLVYDAQSRDSFSGKLKAVKIYFESGDIIFELKKGIEKAEYDQDEQYGSVFLYSFIPIEVKCNFKSIIASLIFMYENGYHDTLLYSHPGLENWERKIWKYHKGGRNVSEELLPDIFLNFYLKIFPERKHKDVNAKLFKEFEEEDKKSFLDQLDGISKGVEIEYIVSDSVYDFPEKFEAIFLYSISEILDRLSIKVSDAGINQFSTSNKKSTLPLTDFGTFVFEEFFEKELNRTFKRVIDIFSIVDSLSSFRANTERLYSASGQVAEMNKLLWEFGQVGTNISHEVKKFIDNSLKLFDIGDKMIINSIQGVTSEIFILKNGRKVLLADLGYGYSQLIPIILKIAISVIRKMGENHRTKNIKPTVFLLEEPESNLHPSLQSKLANFLLDAAKEFNIQFVVETHSEYMIRNFQYLTAKKELDPMSTKIYYFNHPDSDEFKNSPFKEINILEDGRLSAEFGEGFFDEIPRLLAFLYNSSSN